MKCEERFVRQLLPEDARQYAVEVGASDGITLSNTLWLENDGCDVLCIEPYRKLFDDLEKNRKRCVRCACSDHTSASEQLLVYDVEGGANREIATAIEPLEVRLVMMFAPTAKPRVIERTRVDTLDNLLDEQQFPRVDFVSIDVDGIEMKVLAGFDIERWNPAVVLIEHPFEDVGMPEWFKARGYRRAHAQIDKLNDIYVRKGL